jgi:hypothetical protein
MINGVVSRLQHNARTAGTVGVITSVLWIFFTTSWNRLRVLTFATPEGCTDPKSELVVAEYKG